MTIGNAKAKTNETFIVQVSLTIVTYDRQNMFIVQATVYQGGGGSAQWSVFCRIVQKKSELCLS